jgi:ABC-type multidrug transport system fused ATPase/permease subunit
MATAIERMPSSDFLLDEGCGGTPVAILTYIKEFSNSSTRHGAERFLAPPSVEWNKACGANHAKPAMARHIMIEAHPPTIAFHDVSKSYGEGGAVLDRVSLEVREREFLAIVRASGGALVAGRRV